MPPLKPKLLEPILKSAPIADYIEAFSWIPREISVLPHLKITGTTLENYSWSFKEKIGIYGALPSLFNSTHTELLEVAYSDPESALGIVE